MMIMIAVLAIVDVLGAIGAVLPNPRWGEATATCLHLGLCAVNVAALCVLTGRYVLCSVGMLWIGGMVEILQLGIPGRSASWDDLLTDAFGIVLGVILASGADRALEQQALAKRTDLFPHR